MSEKSFFFCRVIIDNDERDPNELQIIQERIMRKEEELRRQERLLRHRRAGHSRELSVDSSKSL